MKTLLALVLMLGVVTLFAAEDDAAKHIGEIAEMIKTGQNAQALERSTALAAEHPKHLGILRQLARLQYDLDKMSDARTTLERMRAIAPDDAGACNLLAVLITYHRSPAQSLEASLDAEARAFKEAAKLLIHATKVDPKYADAWFNLAVVQALGMKPDMKAARDAYGRSIKLGVPRTQEFEKQIGWHP